MEKTLRKEKRKACFFVQHIIVATLLAVTAIAQAGDPASERRIPTTTKLDISLVAFRVSTQPELTDRLYTRAVKQLKNAGLSFYEDPKRSREPIATLTLTLRPRPLEKVCPGKILYDRKLELEEYVMPERNTEIRTRAITWSLAGGPAITEEVTMERLEHDLDEYIHEFIISYKMGNPVKKQN